MHPPREDLAAYLVGSLPEPDADRLEGHLQACPECESTLNLLGTGGDTILETLRRGQPPSAAESESACGSMIEAIKQIGRDPTTPGVSVPVLSPPLGSGGPNLGELRDYKLLTKLGEGGMGAVYRAVHTKLDKVVALKVLPGGRMQNAEAIGRFQREMKAVGKLRHPNIVGAFDAGEADGMHFLVMELVEGENLATIIRRHAPLAVGDACELVRQAAVGLEEAHEHGMVHRDVKPSNLMLTLEKRKSGTTGLVKVLDLGLALLDGSQAGGELTGTGQLMGTLHYMAPEQAVDTHGVDIRADLYSLGVVLYELLTGKIPLEAKRNESVMTKLMALANDSNRSIREVRPDLPEPLIALIDRLLSRNPADRPATPDEVALALEPFAVDHHLAGLLDPSAVRPPHTPAVPKPATVVSDVGPPPLATSHRHGPPRRALRVAAGFAAAFFLVVLGVWFIVRDKDGNEIARVQAPDGSSVSIVKTDDAAKAPTTEVRVSAVAAPAMNDRQPAASPGTPPLGGRSLYVETAEFAAWKKEVVGLAAPDQLTAVLAKLEELNPGFDAKFQPRYQIVGGAVTQLRLWTDSIKDLSPLRVLTRLTSLELVSGGAGELRKDVINLTPLSSLPLRELLLTGRYVADLGPLRTLRLTSLTLDRTRVTDLSPLKEMPLQVLHGSRFPSPEAALAALDVLQSIGTLESAFGQRMVDVQNERPALEQFASLVRELRRANPNYDGAVKSYKVVQGRLTELDLNAPGLNDFSALASVKTLESLDLAKGQYWRPVHLDALSGLRLTKLNLTGCEIDDLSPFRDMPLIRLDISNTRVRDFSSLKEMPLEELWCRDTPWRDGAATCELLRSIPSLKKFNGKPVVEIFGDRDAVAELESLLQQLCRDNPAYDRIVRSRKLANGHVVELSLGDDALTDFSALRALPSLKVLDLGRGHGWRLKDWTFLQGMKLTSLNLKGALIEDLSPVKEMPLTELDLSYSKVVRDLLPLKGLPLEKLTLEEVPLTDLTPLAALPLVEIRCNQLNPRRDTPILKSIATLKTINGSPAETFWKKAEMTK